MSGSRRERLIFNYPLPDSYYYHPGYAQPQRHSAPALGSSFHDYRDSSAVPRTIADNENRCIAPQLLHRSSTRSLETGFNYSYPRPDISDNGDYFSKPAFTTLSVSPVSDDDEPYRPRGAKYITQSSTPGSSNRRRMTDSNGTSGYDIGLLSRAQLTSTSKRVECPHEGCINSDGRQRTFSRPADLKRHIETYHGKNKPFDCPLPRCSRKGEEGFSRKDHCTEHMRGYHKQFIPKRGNSRA